MWSGSTCATTVPPIISTATCFIPACCRRWSARPSAVQAMLPGQLLHLAGFSLGGNFALRVAAQADAASLKIAKVVAISPELDPGETLRAVERGFSFYHRYFMRKWGMSLLRKQAAWPSVYDFAGMLRLPSLRHMTEEMVRTVHAIHDSLEEYLLGLLDHGRQARVADGARTHHHRLRRPYRPDKRTAAFAKAAHPYRHGDPSRRALRLLRSVGGPDVARDAAGRGSGASRAQSVSPSISRAGGGPQPSSWASPMRSPSGPRM